MAMTLRVLEDDPETRPAVEGADTAVPASVVWERLEKWTNYRWGVRNVLFLVQGSGPWEPRLRPATFVSAERWEFGDWVPAEVSAHPLGFDLPDNGDDPFRLAFTVGAATASDTVKDAFRRLTNYMAETEGAFAVAGASSVSGSIGSYSKSWRRSPSWRARAMEHSGAGDLLRPYRRLGA